MSRNRLIALALALVLSLGGFGAWALTRPETCPTLDRPLTRAEMLTAGRVAATVELNAFLETLRRGLRDQVVTPPPATPEMIAALEPDCCRILPDLTGRWRRTFGRTATDAARDALRGFVRVEVTHPAILGELIGGHTIVVALDHCGAPMPMVWAEAP